MSWTVRPYVLPLLAGAAITVALLIWAWRRRHVPGLTAFAMLMLALTEWSLGYALELALTALPAKLLAAKFEYLGIVLVPACWLIFAAQYTDRSRWLTRGAMAGLALVPAVILALVWTNESHGLIWQRAWIDGDDPIAPLNIIHGAGFWVHTAYSYLLLMIGTLWLAAASLRSWNLYRKQALVLLFGALAPWLGNALYLSSLDPFPHLDLTPFAFTLSGAALAWGLFRFRLLDLGPVARDAIIESMSDAVVVLDEGGRIVDYNPAARALFAQPGTPMLGQRLADAFPAPAQIWERFSHGSAAHTELVVSEGEDRRYFDLRISPLLRPGGQRAGRLVALRDLTERRRAEAALEEARALLESRVDERTAELRDAVGQLQKEIAERRAAAEALRQRVEMEKQVAGISTRFINIGTAEIGAEIDRALRLVGENAGADRGYLFQLSDDGQWMDNAYGWCAGGIGPDLHPPRRLPVSDYPWWIDRLQRLETICIGRTSALSGDASDARTALEAHGIRSVAAVPIGFDGRLTGFLGLDALRAEKNWSEEDISLLCMVGEVIATALRRRASDEAIRRSLAEKEVLLREVHHRVKNNLQVISSLLSLQAGATADPQALQVLHDSQNRVRSMALVHEKLLSAPDLTCVDFADYLRNLAEHVVYSYGASPARVGLRIEADGALVGIDTAISCGLIVNELLSNSLKHAFPDGRQGEITIGFARRPGGVTTLRFGDNGVGLPAGLDPGRVDTLGLKLVATLVRQLHGALGIEREGGARFEITFRE